MKEKRAFPIFNSHLDLAHALWQKVAKPGDWAIDATCGNGHDTLFLARYFSGVIGLDIQEKALENTQKLLIESNLDHKVKLYKQSHEAFPSVDQPIRLIAYNLGYLPGGDKELTTLVSSTLTSIQHATILVAPDGLISITCYPGHPEGAREQEAILKQCQALPAGQWSVSYHTWQNRSNSPSLILIQKSKFN